MKKLLITKTFFKLSSLMFLTVSLSGLDIVIDKTSKLDFMVDVQSILSEESSKEMARDVVLGLQRDNTKEIVSDEKTGLIWQDSVAVKTIQKDWVNAKKYCHSLSHAGFNDWHLATIDELESITDFTKKNPAIKDSFVNTALSTYWSSTSSVFKAESAWNINFNTGSSNYSNKKRISYIRCVRRKK